MTAFDALEALGETPDQIASALEAKGIKGEIGDSEACPLVAYLRSCGFKNAVVEEHQFLASKRQGSKEWKDLPPGAKRFVHLFDASYYPNLIRE